MAHMSLYRKYSPATFDDMVGQQHIERTLRNAVAEGNVAHAYLFSGPRGTGKTTTARLLAKALLCERGPTPDPDATCDQCIQVAEGTHPDVYELDAASRTGVDNVREEIIGRVSFAPTRGRYKVYIIDEVHMLSTAAFNALLKTLEEPPTHVVFVMCTTHPNKVPETIQSRCQRFDFRRLSVEDIVDRLRFIAAAEGMTVDRNAFTLMARHAKGGMRDAITALEQITSFTGGEVTADDVEGMLGEVDSAQLFEVAGLIARRDIAACFRWVAAEVETGTELAEMVRELTSHCRDLFIIAAVGDATGVVDRSSEDLSRLQSQAAEFGGPDRLARLLDVLGELAAEMRWSSDPRMSLEVALTRVARPQGDMTLESLAERVEELERSGVAAAVAPSAVAVAAPPVAQNRGVSAGVANELAAPGVLPNNAAPESAVAPAASAPTPTAPAAPADSEAGGFRKLDRAAMKRDWPAVIMEIKEAKPARAQTFVNVEVDIDPDGETLVIEFPSEQAFSMQLAEDADNRELLKRSLAAVFGSSPPFRYQLGRGAVRPAQPVASAPKPIAPPEEPPSEADFAETRSPGHPWIDEGASPSPDPSPEPEAETGEGLSDLERLLVDGLGAKILDTRNTNPDEQES